MWNRVPDQCWRAQTQLKISKTLTKKTQQSAQPNITMRFIEMKFQTYFAFQKLVFFFSQTVRFMILHICNVYFPSVIFDTLIQFVFEILNKIKSLCMFNNL